MQRRSFLKHTGLLAGASIVLQQTVLSQIFQPRAGNIRMLRNNAGIFTERGGTVGLLLTDDGIVVIDSQFPDTAANFISEVKKLNAKPFKYLLNTHHHGDHSSGNIAFKGMVEHVMAHQNSLINQKAVAEKTNTLDKQLLPDVTFTAESTLTIGKDKIRSYYFGPAHTNGDAIFHLEGANVVHMGDLMNYKRHPYVDRTTGANMRSWIQVLDKSIKQFDKDTIYIFGHALNAGEETGSADALKKFQTYLSQVLQFAEKEIKRGVSKEEFIKNTTLPGNTEWSGPGLERPLTAAYEELSAV